MNTEHIIDGADWWAVTAIHEAAHGIVAFALTDRDVELILNRKVRRGDQTAGTCVSRFEKSWYGELSHIFVKNAPFVAHQYECIPCGNKGDLHERAEAYSEFCRMINIQDQELFRKHVDTPLLNFFGSGDVQGAVLYLANKLYNKNHLVIKQTTKCRKELDVPDEVYHALENQVTILAKAISGR